MDTCTLCLWTSMCVVTVCACTYTTNIRIHLCHLSLLTCIPLLPLLHVSSRYFVISCSIFNRMTEPNGGLVICCLVVSACPPDAAQRQRWQENSVDSRANGALNTFWGVFEGVYAHWWQLWWEMRCVWFRGGQGEVKKEEVKNEYVFGRVWDTLESVTSSGQVLFAVVFFKSGRGWGWGGALEVVWLSAWTCLTCYEPSGPHLTSRRWLRVGEVVLLRLKHDE